MTGEELLNLLQEIQVTRCETQTLEIKATEKGCPKRLYDTLSSFSNQDDGGTIVFGVDEGNGFAECGVYDPQDLQKKINDHCLQMEPVIRPVLTVAEKGGKCFVAAEIPGMELSIRPCYYRGKGQMKGAYVRVGDSDEPMTDYEIYSYEAFRRKYQDDIRAVPRAMLTVLDPILLEDYLHNLKLQKPNLSALDDQTIYELMSITRQGEVTLSAVMLFCRYPQVFFPQLCITAVVLPGNEDGSVGMAGERFIDNQRIEGTIPEMLEQTIAFVRKNMKLKTIINPETGKREDRTEYPVTAIREAVLNTLVHRDYSVYTEGMPIQIRMYPDRIEMHNPGGIYGRIRIDQLGRKQPDTRNLVLATAMKVLKITENRYSGIPTIRHAMADYGLREPVFEDHRGSFSVTFYNETIQQNTTPTEKLSDKEKALLRFLTTPHTRQEIIAHLGLQKSPAYAVQRYVKPLQAKGLIKLTIPEKPGSPKQNFYCGKIPD